MGSRGRGRWRCAASTGTSWRSRPTSATGCPACTWSGCPTRRCSESQGPGAGGRRQLRAAPGPTGGSCSRCPRPPCARPAAPSTWRSPAASSRAEQVVEQPALDGTVAARRAGARRPAAPGPRRPAVPAGGPRRRYAPRGRAESRSLDEAALVDGIEVLGAASLSDVLVWLRGAANCRGRHGPVVAARGSSRPISPTSSGRTTPGSRCEIAAAGGHHLLLIGPPGHRQDDARPAASSGCSRRCTEDDALTLATVRSVAGRLPARRAGSRTPAARSRRTTPARLAALVGGGSGLARPGAVSLAHRGVLFLDEAPEFESPPARRAAHPAGGGRGAARPHRGHGPLPGPVPARARRQPVPMRAGPRPRLHLLVRWCSRRYLGRLSGPLLDRVDLHARLFPVTTFAAARRRREHRRSSAAGCWRRARRRWSAGRARAGAPTPKCRGPHCAPGSRCPRSIVRPLDIGLRSGLLSARSADRALRVAWTLADLAGDSFPAVEQVESALSFRERRAA